MVLTMICKHTYNSPHENEKSDQKDKRSNPSDGDSNVRKQYGNQLNDEAQHVSLKITSTIRNLQEIDRDLRDISGKIEVVNIAYVACGAPTNVDQVFHSIRSALYFSTDIAIKFHIFVQREFEGKFHFRFRGLHLRFQTKFTYQLYPAKIPDDKVDWNKLFGECNTMRLFLPRYLTDLDAVLFMDSDTLFLDSVSHLWDVLNDLNPDILLAYSRDSCFNYHSETGYPFLGEFGLNSGVLLMRLDRIRTAIFSVKGPNDKLTYKLPWEDALELINEKYIFKLSEQSMLNILFSFNSEKGLEFSCNMNYMLIFCQFTKCERDCCKPKPHKNQKESENHRKLIS